MRNRTKRFSVGLSGLLLALGAASFTAAPGASAVGDTSEVAEAWQKDPVYVDPAASDQLSDSQADALAQKIEDAGKPVFVAVLPQDFPRQDIFQKLRTETGVTGVYAVRLGDGFDAKADRSVLTHNAVTNLVSLVRGQDANTQLNEFVDEAIAQAAGGAPRSWSGAPAGDGVSVGALAGVGVVLVAGGVGAYAVIRRKQRRHEQAQREALRKLSVVVDEDITAFGEELDRLDFHPAEPGADDAMRADYERALDAYEKAKSYMAGGPPGGRRQARRTDASGVPP